MKTTPGGLPPLFTCRGLGMMFVWVAIAMQPVVEAQTASPSGNAPATSGQAAQLEQRVQTLEAEVKELRQVIKQLQASGGPPAQSAESPANVQANSAAAATPVRTSAISAGRQGSDSSASLTAADPKTLDFLRETTVNVGLDGYYGYNFNHPV